MNEDEKNGVQRYPRKNEEIIYDTKVRLFRLMYESIRAKYSIGMECKSLEEDYTEMIPIILDIGWEKIGYVHFIQVFSLGILLEVSKEQLEQLVALADKELLDDSLFDFLAKAYGLKREKQSNNYQKENSYRETEKIIELSFKDKKNAALELQIYMEEKWFQGHYDYEWKNAHKRAGYVGFWSFETAALAKVLTLNDDGLQDNNHYPYDLAHYKSGKTFSLESFGNIQENEQTDGESGITERRELEQVIPKEFRKLINQVIVDYAELRQIDFWKKYRLDDNWFTADEFLRANTGKQLLGNIIINVLVDKGYVLQLDYKENVAEYIASMPNYWNGKDVKLIRFELDNDQNYYAIVPKNIHLDRLYEVDIFDVRSNIE